MRVPYTQQWGNLCRVLFKLNMIVSWLVSGGGFYLGAAYPEGFHGTFPLHLNYPSRSQRELLCLLPQKCRCTLGAKDTTGKRVAFHPRGRIHGITDQSVLRIPRTHDSSNHRSRMKPNAYIQKSFALVALINQRCVRSSNGIYREGSNTFCVVKLS